MYPLLVFSGHERTLLQALYQHEVDDGCDSDTPEDGDAVFHVLLVVESEHHTCQPLHQDAEEEGDGHGQEYTHDDGQCLIGIDEVAETQRVAAVHLDK